MTGCITIRDALKAGFCPRGIREKCDHLGLDFADIRANGLALDVADTIDDDQINRAATVARQRISEELKNGSKKRTTPRI